MSTENTKKFLELVSDKESGWLKDAKWRQDNEDWLNISFSIAVKILSVLRENKKTNDSPSNLIELSNLMNISTSDTRNMLRGKYDFNLSTITKLEKILKTKLI